VNIVHPRLLQMLPRFYSSTCTIQQAIEAQDAVGQPIPTWANVAGLANLPCAVAPLAPSPERAERSRADSTIEVATHHISIAGYHPTIANKMRAVVAAVAYDIIGAEVDSHAITTRLRVVLVK
jgi:hypothetical protein